ncbi:NUDIX domain-containing protein [Pseudidiomarina marina]|uniref:ADP-ribose pyrophosphatase n=1 Tax=Pseudidiomarina marina TaxID=502366 RepID=A0A432YL85_9GAMM|nr:NUDIX domain-containing protein [Pseudidiomarina marina]RUO61724.1 ADP-ribose diphosphatase [Pseudidiomarina marina]
MQKYNQNDVKVIEKTLIREGFLSLYKLRLQHRLFEGDWSPVFDREVMDRGHAVVVLPYDPQKDALVVLEQFRVGALGTDASPWLLEFVAGMYDSNDETAEQVAHRELQEEAGLATNSLHYALTYLSTPGGCTEKISIYIALVDSDKAARHAGLATEHEDIRVHVLPYGDVVQLLEAGKINNAASVIGLQWLQLHKRQFEDL